MTDDPVPSPTPAAPAAREINAIMTSNVSAFVSALALLYSADYILVWLPRFEDVYKSVNVNLPLATRLIFDYGLAVWAVMVLGTIISYVEIHRRPGQRRTVAISVIVVIGAVSLAAFVRHATLAPVIGLFQGIGVQQQ